MQGGTGTYHEVLRVTTTACPTAGVWWHCSFLNMAGVSLWQFCKTNQKVNHKGPGWLEVCAATCKPSVPGPLVLPELAYSWTAIRCQDLQQPSALWLARPPPRRRTAPVRQRRSQTALGLCSVASASAAPRDDETDSMTSTDIKMVFLGWAHPQVLTRQQWRRSLQSVFCWCGLPFHDGLSRGHHDCFPPPGQQLQGT